MSYINSALHIYSNGYNSTSQSYSTLLDHSIAQISTVHAGTQKAWTCFGVRLAPSRHTAFALRRVEATVMSASPEGLTTVTDALSAKARRQMQYTLGWYYPNRRHEGRMARGR